MSICNIGSHNINALVRTLGKSDEYCAPDSQGIAVSGELREGKGSADEPYRIEVRVTNTDENVWSGIVRFGLRIETEAPRFYLPGFMYGTNRGEAPLLVDSKCPRLRETEDFPASPWWMVRSDRLSHPCAFVYGEGKMLGISATPYFIRTEEKQIAWEPGMKEDFAQYAGYGCSLADKEVWYTLGYENAPFMFIDSHKYHERKALGENCFCLEAGETVFFALYVFELEGEDERILHDALKWVYSKYHETPRRMCSVHETVKDMATVIAKEAWMPQNHSYTCFVFDKGDSYEYRILPSISWTNGLSAAVPMLMSGLRLGNEEMRLQALDCIEYIVSSSINEKSGLPFLVEKDGKWSNNGWWYEKQPTPGHVAYLIGQSVYLILKAYEWEKKERGIEHYDWLDFAGKIVAKTETGRNSDGEYPYIYSDRTGAGMVYDSFSGSWCMAAAAYLSLITGDQKYIPDLMRSARYYHDAYIRHQECYGGPLDIDKNMDSEGILAYIRAVRCLHEITSEECLLDYMRDALYYEYTFKFCYNSPIKIPPLSTIGWSSCGGSITSVVNPHIHPMSSSVMDEMVYYLSKREDKYIEGRLEDTVLWSCQCHMVRDKEFGYGKKGWMSERFCHSEGLLTEHYPDGSPASTWFALMPWACGSILEGLTGDIWTKNT